MCAERGIVRPTQITRQRTLASPIIAQFVMMASIAEKQVYIPSNPEYTNVEKFRREINRKRGINLSGYQDLHTYSVHSDTNSGFLAGCMGLCR